MTDYTQPPSHPLSPYLVVGDAAAAIAFYQRAFAATELTRQTTPDGKKVIHAALLINGALLMLSDDFPELTGGSRTPAALGGSPVTLHLAVDDVDAVWQRAIDAGAVVTMALEDQFWGDRYGKLVDPFGHSWSVATTKRVVTTEELRAHAAAFTT